MAGTAQTYTTSVPITSGATFANLQSYGIKGVIDKILDANPAITNPVTAPTMTATGGASGTTKYYKATTGTTADLTIAAFEDDTVAAPTTNTTAASTYAKYANVYANMTRMLDLLTAYQTTLDDFLRGDPINQNEVLVRLQLLTACLAAVYKAVDNATALAFANTGTLAFDSSAKHGPNGAIRRTFP